MKKLSPYLISIAIVLLNGCGTAQEQSVVNNAPSMITTDNTVEEDAIEKEKAKEYAEDELVDLTYMIDPDPKTGDITRLSVEIDNDRHYFSSGDVYNEDIAYVYGVDGAIKQSYYSQNDEIKRIFSDCFNKYIGPKVDIGSLYMDMANIFIDNKTDPSDLSPVDISDSFPSTITLNIEGNDIVVDVIHSEFESVHSNLSYSETSVPSYPHDKGYVYLGRVKIVLTVPDEQLSTLYSYVEKVAAYETVNADEETQEVVDDNTEKSVDENTGIVGRWYPGDSDFKEYYIQIDEGGSGTIHRDEQVISISYTFDGSTIRIMDDYGGTQDFYYYDDELVADVDGEVYKKSGAIEGSNNANDQIASSFDLLGNWYDPTGLSAAKFTFNADGTGMMIGEYTADNMTYSISGNTITCVFPRSSYTLTIIGDKLSDGESKYIKK